MWRMSQDARSAPRTARCFFGPGPLYCHCHRTASKTAPSPPGAPAEFGPGGAVEADSAAAPTITGPWLMVAETLSRSYGVAFSNPKTPGESVLRLFAGHWKSVPLWTWIKSIMGQRPNCRICRHCIGSFAVVSWLVSVATAGDPIRN